MKPFSFAFCQYLCALLCVFAITHTGLGQDLIALQTWHKSLNITIKVWTTRPWLTPKLRTTLEISAEVPSDAVSALRGTRDLQEQVPRAMLTQRCIQTEHLRASRTLEPEGMLVQTKTTTIRALQDECDQLEFEVLTPHVRPCPSTR